MSLKKGFYKGFKYFLYIIGSVFVSSLLVIVFCLFTQSGNQKVIDLVEHLESRISLQLAEGSLFDSPVIEHISWLDGETNIKVNRLHYQFDWSCLLDSLCLNTLSIDGLSITLPKENTEQQTNEENNSEAVVIDLPIALIIKNIDITNFKLNVAGLSVELKKLNLSANAASNNVTIASQINDLLITLPDSNTKKVAKVAPVKTKQRKDLTFNEIPAILSEQMLPIVRLPINLDIAPLIIENVEIIQNNEAIFKLNKLDTQLTFSETLLKVEKFNLDIPETMLDMSAKINFIDNYPLDITINGVIRNIDQLAQETLLNGVQYKLQSHGSLSDLNNELILSNNINLQLRSHFDLFQKNLPHDIDLSLQDFNWPFNGKAEYKINSAHFSSKGALTNHHFSLQSDYSIMDLPSGKVSLNTQGNLQQLNVKSLKVETLQGDVDFSGLLSWKENINWLGELKINDIDLADLKTDYDGHFSGVIQQNVDVTLFDNSEAEWQFDFPIINIAGDLLERPFSIGGRVSGDHLSGILFDQLAVKNAENKILVNGKLAQQNALQLNLDIVDISHLVVDTKGDIKGNVSINGPQEKLLINSELSSQGLLYKAYEVGQLALSSDLTLSEKPQVNLKLSANDILVEKQKIDDLNININNQVTESNNVQHTVQLILNSELVSTDLHVLLTQTNEELLTQLNQANIEFPYQTLTLSSPFDLIYKQHNVEISPHCWKATTDMIDSGNLCIEEFNVGDDGNISLNINEYQVMVVNQFLPEELQLTGTVSSDAHIKWKNAENPIFDITLNSKDILVKINSEGKEGTYINYPMETFDVNLNGTENIVDIDLTLFAEKLIDISMEGKLQPYLDEPTIDSNIRANLADFSLFQPLIPSLEELQGKLHSKFIIDGKLNKPNVDGLIMVQDGRVSSQELPMKITELTAEIAISKDTANLQASFNSSDTNTIAEKTASLPLITNTLNIFDKSIKKVSNGIIDRNTNNKSKIDESPGVAFINGELDWSNKFQGKLHLYANKLEIYDYGKIDLLLSPDVNVLIGEHISVNGNLLIDKGKIVVKELPAGAISESKDIVVVDVEKENISENLPVIIDLGVDMGNSFQLVAVGLDTFIEGQLLVKKPLEQDLTINGVLQLSDGSYRALGQQLVLQDSQIVFQGSPESPYLQIEAIRDSSKIEDDVTAGVRVTGTPDELELVIFSDPAMAQQEALSYLTRGKGLDSSSDSSTMANMMIDLAAGQSEGLMSSIGEEIGIKDLSLESSGTGDEQSVGIRGEIAPGVEVSYGVGVFDSFSILSLRYQLIENLYIEASSGVYQAIDAYYEWDWD